MKENKTPEVVEQNQNKPKVKTINTKDILVVKHLKQFFNINTGGFRTRKLKAVNDVSFSIHKGETLGLVGESGCGKTTTGRCIQRLYKITGGSIYFKGQRIAGGTRWNEKEIKYTKLRYNTAMKELKIKYKELDITKAQYQEEVKIEKDKKDKIIAAQKKEIAEIKHDNKNVDRNLTRQIQMIFQDPYSSLDPRMTVEDIIAEPLDVYHLCKTKDERRNRVLELMKTVGLSSEQATRYAHEFSGGQRQRIGIARALALNPEFIICDEPVSALDVSIQAQVINTFVELKKKLGLTYLFVAHNLLVVKHISDRIAVMYLGHIVELAPTDELFKNPMHPYTNSLLSAIPMPDPKEARSNKRIILSGDIPSPLNAPSGCPFRTRCSKATEICSKKRPELKEFHNGHYVACHLFDGK
jgi:oligopeptide transport system ATP-binding protein